MTRRAGTLHADQYTFLHISGSVLLGKVNSSEKRCRKSKQTFHVQNLLFEKRVAYDVVHIPTNALFINFVKSFKFTLTL